MRKEGDCRYLMVHVDPQTIMGFINRAMWKDGTTVPVPVFDRLPRDVVVEDVREDFQRRSFAFLLYHETFDNIPMGSLIPTHDGKMSCIHLPACYTEDEARRLAKIWRNPVGESSTAVLEILSQA